MRIGRAATVIGLVAFFLPLARVGIWSALAGNPFACNLQPDVALDVVRVVDGETFRVADGREVRLAGALAPEPPAETTAETWIPAAEARRALEALVGGKSVLIAPAANRRPDRHGRLSAQVFVRSDAGLRWIEGEMVSSGQARAYALPGQTDCLDALIAREAEARRAGHGLWQHAAYAVLEAANPEAIMRLRSSFAVVEGKVVRASVRNGKGYLDFGADWRTDFTAFVPARLLTADKTLAGRLEGLTEKKVRVRGWVERRNGPSIEIMAAAEIEVVE